MSDPYIGEIRAFGFHFAPAGWMFCNGELLSISQYQALFAVIGTIYGGNGTTNFQLPNFQSTAPLGQGSGPGLTPRPIGEPVGEAAVTLTLAQMPGHNHILTSYQGQTATQSVGTPTATVFPGNSNPGQTYSDTTNALTQTFSPKAISFNGGSTPHNNIQPLLVMNFCICYNGIFPVRN